MRASLLLLADSRLPAGGHAHSGGVEPAVSAGVIGDVPALADFLRGRLATSGLVAAALAAAACAHALEGGDAWALLDAEADARTPSPAQRKAARAQGRSLLRVARTTWPARALEALAVVSPDGPHHPLVLGAATASLGGTPHEAAAVTAYNAVTGGASAGVRLLGLDPLEVNRALAALAEDVDAVAAKAAACTDGPWTALPAASAPLLDIYAELHLRADLRLFES
ncbi:urease accessory protein UreF [Actinomadura macrotermitis]|uniref:Urease accessory protein UreF n=1 Tax=Actinomadura macrotermitis TaxID=2585200 RepID=A0A7K0BN93_9ACTN|nr:urease accessory UreF family protein [Actinomadura macrotermitis]MQY02658.1 Urease accessory protein UreF [Actinomadura macrotermitis]